MIEDGEDGNNNGDINGNSEMVDLHNRRIQEEREREQQQVRERNVHVEEEPMVNIEDRNVIIERTLAPQIHDINLEEAPNELIEDHLVQGACALDYSTHINDVHEDNKEQVEDSADNLIAINVPSSTSLALLADKDNITENASEEGKSSSSVEKNLQNKNSDENKSLDEL